MTQQEEDKLKTEFREMFCDTDGDFHKAYPEQVENYWISKIKEREESLVQRIKKLESASLDDSIKTVWKQDVINLINKENE
jgi:hypothetical protein